MTPFLARSRWAAIGAAVAVTLGAGGGLVLIANADSPSSSFIAITPCRLFDLRPDTTVGNRNTPLTTNETFTRQVWGANGACNIPTSANAIAYNLTVPDPAATGFVKLYPGDAPVPNASAINPIAGGGTVANSGIVGLSATGGIAFVNQTGPINALLDITGYFVAAAGGGTSNPPGGPRVLLDPAAFRHDGQDAGFYHNFSEGRLQGGGVILCAAAPLFLPHGATVTGVVAHVKDSTSGAGNDVVVRLWRNPVGVNSAEQMFSVGTTGIPGDITLTSTTIVNPKIDNAADSYFVSVCGLNNSNFLYDVRIDYANP